MRFLALFSAHQRQNPEISPAGRRQVTGNQAGFLLLSRGKTNALRNYASMHLQEAPHHSVLTLYFRNAPSEVSSTMSSLRA